MCCRAHVSCLPGWTATTDQVSSHLTHAMHSTMHADAEHNSYDLMLGPLPARYCAHFTFLGLSFSFLRQQKLCQAETSHKGCWESVPLHSRQGAKGETSSHRFATFHLATVSSFKGADTTVPTLHGLSVLTKPISSPSRDLSACCSQLSVGCRLSSVCLLFGWALRLCLLSAISTKLCG